MSRKLKQSFAYDDLAWKLLGLILEDLKTHCSEDFYEAVYPLIRDRNVKAYRALVHTPKGSVTQLKAEYQVISFLKKFSFEVDALSPKEVLNDSQKKFLDNQNRLNTDCRVPRKSTTSVLSRARGHCDRILGEFSKFDVMERAAFGYKSSVGVPQRKACEAQRYEGPISGSVDQILWFTKLYASWNRPAFNYACERSGASLPSFQICDTLEAVLVDKTWKSKRMIMPNTTLGTLYSKGLGRYLEDRLRVAGYDIKVLQPVHRNLARIGSVTGKLVTADQSLASDNLTEDLIDCVLPLPWADACKLGRISKIGFYGHLLESKTFCTMGIGFTFPLQTLIFLSLLLGIRDELNLCEGTTVSVFGDDLIYDSDMHSLTLSVFGDLGLIINEDKTFFEGNFRESCGGDYYHGFDVRPFHLGRSAKKSSLTSSEAYLYKTINGLRQRWSDADIPLTLDYLVNYTYTHKGNMPLFHVPFDYPATSGVVGTFPWPNSFKNEIRRDKHGVFRYKYLAFQAATRIESRHKPYLFLSLRKTPVVDKLAYLALARINTSKTKRCYNLLSESSTSIFTEEVDHFKGTFCSKLSNKWLPHTRTLIAEIDKGIFVRRSGVSGKWTP